MNDHFISAQIASDLAHIHKNRIDTFIQLLHEPGNMELDMKAILERMIEESVQYKQQLQKQVKAGADDTGEIYTSWQTMINPVAGRDKKTILATLADDELIMMNTYSMAISLVTEADMIELLESQQQGLKKLHTHIRQYHHAQ